MERLAKNIGGYRGDALNLTQVLRDIDAAATNKNWSRDTVPLPFTGSAQPIEFIAYRRQVESPRNNIYLSAGIHGDEPAGPLAVLQLLQEDRWPADAALWLCPCLNPSGLRLNQRENFQGIDLNRDYRHLQSEEVRAHQGWLQQQPRFNISLCLHEDWEAAGFYVYEVNPEQGVSLAGKIIEAAAKVCPIENASTVDTWPAENGVIRPQLNPADRPQWPETLYLITNNTRLGYTLEAPSDFPLPGRVAALVAAVRAVLEAL